MVFQGAGLLEYYGSAREMPKGYVTKHTAKELATKEKLCVALGGLVVLAS